MVVKFDLWIGNYKLKFTIIFVTNFARNCQNSESSEALGKNLCNHKSSCKVFGVSKTLTPADIQNKDIHRKVQESGK